MIANDQHDMPEPIRRRLGLPEAGDDADEQIEEIARAGHMRLHRYEVLLLQASAGIRVDAEALHDAAAAVGRGPHRVAVDLNHARAHYLRWRSCFNPV